MSYGNEREIFRTKVCPFLIVNDGDSDFVDVGCYGPMCMWYRGNLINDDGSVGGCSMTSISTELENVSSSIRELNLTIGRR